MTTSTTAALFAFAILTFLAVLVSIIRKPPLPPDGPIDDDFDELIDEYMIYDPDLDGKI